MHENNVAHRYMYNHSPQFSLLFLCNPLSDCTRANIMLDLSGMYPESFHPVAIDRSKDIRKKAEAYPRTRRPAVPSH